MAIFSFRIYIKTGPPHTAALREGENTGMYRFRLRRMRKKSLCGLRPDSTENDPRIERFDWKSIVCSIVLLLPSVRFTDMIHAFARRVKLPAGGLCGSVFAFEPAGFRPCHKAARGGAAFIRDIAYFGVRILTKWDKGIYNIIDSIHARPKRKIWCLAVWKHLDKWSRLRRRENERQRFRRGRPMGKEVHRKKYI